MGRRLINKKKYVFLVHVQTTELRDIAVLQSVSWQLVVEKVPSTGKY